MANLNLKDLKGRVEKDYAPFVVEYGEDDDPKEVEFLFFISTSSKNRRALVNFGVNAQRYLTGSLTELEAQELFDSGEDTFSKMVSDAKDALKDLSTDKRQFNAFVKAVDSDDWIIWTSILNAYFDHFGIMDKGVDGDVLKSEFNEEALGEASPSQTS